MYQGLKPTVLVLSESQTTAEMKAEAERNKSKPKLEVKAGIEVDTVKEAFVEHAPSTVPSSNEEPEEERCSSAISRSKTPSEKEVDIPSSKACENRFNEELSEIVCKEVENSPKFAEEIIKRIGTHPDLKNEKDLATHSEALADDLSVRDYDSPVSRSPVKEQTNQ